MDVPLQTIGLTIGAALCGLVVLQSLLWAARSWMEAARRRREYRQRREEFCAQVRATLRTAEARLSHVAWEGWRQFRVAAMADEAVDTKSLYLTPTDGIALGSFEPGQYLTFRARWPGNEKPVVRCYSLSDRPHADFYRCTIKRMTAPAERPDLPAGRMSSYLLDQVQVGDFLEAQAPRGTFFLEPESDHPVVLIGGGIGVTPLISMLNSIADQGDKREVHALLCFRNSRSHPFKEHVAALAAAHSNLHLHVNYSAPQDTDVEGVDFHLAGRLTIDHIRQRLPSNNFHFYVCGPSGMMESLVPDLLEWGVPSEDIRYEAFGPASVKVTSRQRIPVVPDQPCDVCFARQGCSLQWEGTFDSLLEFAEANGVILESGCRAGNCGQCLTAIKSGRVTALKKPAVPVDEGHCLTCVSVPAGPLVLDT